MNKKSFFGGLLTGVILTFVGLFIYGLLSQETGKFNSISDPIQYLEQPVSYENKKETSFQVFQVLGDAALANEISNNLHQSFNGNVVLLLGDDFYNDQIITITHPQRVGTYSYTTKTDMSMTVPVISSGQ